MQPVAASTPQVLIVDDDDALRAMLSELIEDSGCTALHAVHGKHALEILRQQSPLPRLIMLDLMMPVMDGWEFRQAQLADPHLASIPVIVLSALADVTMGTAELVAQAYLQKPLDIVHLQQLVTRYCA